MLRLYSFSFNLFIKYKLTNSNREQLTELFFPAMSIILYYVR